MNAPLPLRWHWEIAPEDRIKQVVLRSPRGVRWQFRLRRGAWLRKLSPTASSGSPDT